MGIPYSTMSRILQRLGSGSQENTRTKGLGLVKTEEDVNDWRLIQASLTSKGQEVVDVMAELIAGEPMDHA